MKRLVLTALFIGCMATPAFADLDAFLSSLNVQARADMNGLALKVGAQFGVPLAQVNASIAAVRSWTCRSRSAFWRSSRWTSSRWGVKSKATSKSTSPSGSPVRRRQSCA